MMTSALVAIGIIVIVYAAFMTHLVISYRKEIGQLKLAIDRIEVAITFAQSGDFDTSRDVMDKRTFAPGFGLVKK